MPIPMKHRHVRQPRDGSLVQTMHDFQRNETTVSFITVGTTVSHTFHNPVPKKIKMPKNIINLPVTQNKPYFKKPVYNFPKVNVIKGKKIILPPADFKSAGMKQ